MRLSCLCLQSDVEHRDSAAAGRGRSLVAGQAQRHFARRPPLPARRPQRQRRSQRLLALQHW